MTDQSNEQGAASTEEPTLDEMTVLKGRARLMGIAFSNNIGLDALRAKISAKQNNEDEADTKEAEQAEQPVPVSVPVPAVAGATPDLEAVIAELRARLAALTGQAMTPPNPLVGQTEMQPVNARAPTLRQHLMQTEMRLVRLRITNLDPKKKDLPGEIIVVANEHLGTVSKFIPFGEVTDDGYHVPWCIYTVLQERKFQDIRIIKAKNGEPERITQKWVREFALEVLPPLTESEMKELSTAQLAAGLFTPED